jgi:cyclohexa-1,5-dienecarbonyl-CoA hydratase
MTSLLRLDQHRDGRVLDIVIDNPKGNILTGKLMRELGGVLIEHAGSPHLGLVMIRGAGKHFSFGASVEEHQRDQAAEMLTTFHALMRQIGSYPVPIAGVVDGRCLGGAFELALCCHFVLATERAIFACPEIKLGVFPPVLAAVGPLRLGAGWAEKLLLTGAELGASTAHALGFVTELLPSDGDLAEHARAWYDTHLGGLSAFSLRQAVSAVRRGSGMLTQLDGALATAERQYLGELVASHDGNEGIQAFIEKRSPTWRDC